MTYGTVVHSEVSAREQERQRAIGQGKRTAATIDAAERWCRRWIPESIDPRDGRACPMFIGAAMTLRWSLGRRPTTDEVLNRVAALHPWVLDELENQQRAAAR